MRVVRPRAAARCYRAAFDLMPRGGAIIQYTYGMRPPVDPQLAGLRLDARFLGREWRNLPPIAIWRYRQPAEATLEAAMQRTPAQSA
jgi:phosphatidylethanolamine/phosphatidyl-N-methylethanolamine N-methyltransferase